MENSQLPQPHTHHHDFDKAICTPNFKKKSSKKHEQRASDVGSLQKVAIFFRQSLAEIRGGKKMWGKTSLCACEGKKQKNKYLDLTFFFSGKQQESRIC